MDTYDVALVCQNGHVINEFAASMPQFSKKFCTECGGLGISKCPGCTTPIQGSCGSFEVPDDTPFHAPNFCHECGKPYPWTVARIQAAQQLVDMAAASASDKESLKNGVPALLTNTPQTPVVAAKWKQFLLGAGKQVADAGRDILVDVVSESVKKTIWGP